jgi:hypothetical protein
LLADEIRDGDDYSVTLPQGVHPCFTYPKTLYDPAACDSDQHPVEADPAAPARAFADGTVIVDGRKASVTAMHVAVDQPTAIEDLVEVADYARGMVKGMKNEQPTVRIVGEPGTRVVAVGGLSLGRITFELDGLPGLGRAHQINYVVWAADGTYALSWLGLASSAAAIDAIADQTASTLRLAHPAKPKPPSLLPGLSGRILWSVGTLVALVAWLAARGRRVVAKGRR